MLHTRPGQVASSTSSATMPSPESSAPAPIISQASKTCRGSQIQAISVASRAVKKTAQGTDRRGTARGENTVIMETRLKIASAASNQSIENSCLGKSAARQWWVGCVAAPGGRYCTQGPQACPK